MYLDIAICVILVLCLLVGWHRGFARTILGFVAAALSFILAVVLSRPLTSFFNNVFGMPNNFIYVFIIGSVVYIFLRVSFWFAGRFISRVKERSRIVDEVDKVAGILLGFAKFFMLMCVAFIVIHLLSVIPFTSSAVDALFHRSVIGEWFYGIIRRMLRF